MVAFYCGKSIFLLYREYLRFNLNAYLYFIAFAHFRDSFLDLFS